MSTAADSSSLRSGKKRGPVHTDGASFSNDDRAPSRSPLRQANDSSSDPASSLPSSSGDEVAISTRRRSRKKHLKFVRPIKKSTDELQVSPTITHSDTEDFADDVEEHSEILPVPRTSSNYLADSGLTKVYSDSLEPDYDPNVNIILNMDRIAELLQIVSQHAGECCNLALLSTRYVI
jgi:hypothetical protein